MGWRSHERPEVSFREVSERVGNGNHGHAAVQRGHADEFVELMERAQKPARAGPGAAEAGEQEAGVVGRLGIEGGGGEEETAKLEEELQAWGTAGHLHLTPS